jgi:hypothetical protein
MLRPAIEECVVQGAWSFSGFSQVLLTNTVELPQNKPQLLPPNYTNSGKSNGYRAGACKSRANGRRVGDAPELPAPCCYVGDNRGRVSEVYFGILDSVSLHSRFSQRLLWRVLSPGVWRRGVHVNYTEKWVSSQNMVIFYRILLDEQCDSTKSQIAQPWNLMQTLVNTQYSYMLRLVMWCTGSLYVYCRRLMQCTILDIFNW